MRLLSVQLPKDEYHKRVGGGLPTGSIVLSEGPHGSGKSVLCQRLVYGLLSNGYKATYISTQMTTVEFINQMTSMDYKITKELIGGHLLYIPVYPLLSKNIRKENFIEKIIHTKALYENDIIVFDSLSTIIANDANPEKIDDLMAFFKRIASTEKVIIMTVNPGELPSTVNEQLRIAATIIMELELKPFAGDIKNIVKIVKYNFAQQNFQRVTAFRVEPKIGLVVEITSIS